MNLMFEKQIKLFENTELRYSMPDQWELSKLKRIARFQYGESLSELNRKEGEICVYGSNGIVGYHNLSLSKGPTIVVGRKGSAGAVNYSQSECFPIDTTFFIDQKSTKCDLRWLYYALLWLELHNMNSDSAVPGLNRKQAYQRLLLKPPYPEQRIIAAYLDKTFTTIDAAIDIKRKQLGSLDALKKSIIHKAFTRGLDDSVVLKDSGVQWLGKIPAHWHVSQLKWISTLQTGITLGKKYSADLIERPYLRVANVQDGYLDLKEVKTVFVPESEASGSKLQQHDVLMTEGGDLDKLGRGHLWDGQIPDCIHQNHIFAIRCNIKKLLPEFLTYLTASCYGRAYFEATGKRTTNLASTNATKIRAFPLPLPSISEQESIIDSIREKVSQLDDVQKNLNIQITTLENYRKSLIHECVTGKRRITEDDLAPV